MMELKKLEYERSWENSADFPTFQDSEMQVRADMQYHPNVIRDHINEMVDELTNAVGAPGGIASLDDEGKVPEESIPAVFAKGEPGGVAELDETGKVPESQLPASYTGMESFNGRSGKVLPEKGDYDSSEVAASDEAAELFGLGEDATVDDVLTKTASNLTRNYMYAVVEKITSSQTWVAPKALNQTFKVFAVGGGGGGATYNYESAMSQGYSCGGGGGGYVEIQEIVIPEGTPVDIVCGSGGAHGEKASGSDGGATIFGDYLTAAGGKGGKYSSYGNGHGGDGGAGGGGGACRNSSYPGGTGGAGGTYGGGGGGGGRTSTTSNGNGGTGGAGGTYGGGGGGGYGSTAGTAGQGGTYGGDGGAKGVDAENGTRTAFAYIDGCGNSMDSYGQCGTTNSYAGGGGGGYGGNGGNAYNTSSTAGGGGGGYGGAGGAGDSGGGGGGGNYGGTGGIGHIGGGGGGGLFCSGGNGANYQVTTSGTFQYNCGGGGGGIVPGKTADTYTDPIGGSGGCYILYYKEATE